MSAIKTMFEYTDIPQSVCEPDDFVLKVPSEILLKGELFEAMARAGFFPDYFGGNWDALQDCLLDLSWIDAKTIVLAHCDLPLHDHPSECRTYLEILQAVCVSWLEGPKSEAMEPISDWPYVDHELRVIFPLKAREMVERLLS
jgi:hypothetical protein